MAHPHPRDALPEAAAAPEPEGVLIPGVSEDESVREYVRSLSEELALMARRDGVNDLVQAVPADLADHPLLAHARMDWRIYRLYARRSAYWQFIFNHLLSDFGQSSSCLGHIRTDSFF